MMMDRGKNREGQKIVRGEKRMLVKKKASGSSAVSDKRMSFITFSN